MSKRTHDEKVRRRRMLDQRKNERNARLLGRQRQRARRDLYPRIEFLGGDADPHWTEVITRVLNQVDFEDRNYFSEEDSRLCRLHKQLGAERLMHSLLNDSSPDRCKLGYWYPSLLGDVVFRRMTAEDWRICPMGRQSNKRLAIHDVNVTPRGDHFAVTFSSLRRGPIGGYGTRKTHDIFVDTDPAQIFFSEHAMERTQSRLIPSALNSDHEFLSDYAAWGDLYAFFDLCRYFERCVLPNGSPGLSFYADCFVDQSSAYVATFMTNLAEAIVGPTIHSVERGTRWYYRVGYAPVARDGDRWALKTVLPPGYGGTPEYVVLQKTPMPQQERLQKLKQLNGWTADRLVGTSDYELPRWFHANGNAQVVAFEGDLFAHEVGTGPLRPPKRVLVTAATSRSG